MSFSTMVVNELQATSRGQRAFACEYFMHVIFGVCFHCLYFIISYKYTIFVRKKISDIIKVMPNHFFVLLGIFALV